MSEKSNHLFRLNRGTFWFRPLGAVVIALLPMFLGGGADPLVEIIICFAVGLFLIAVPAQSSLLPIWKWLVVILAILPLLVFLPHGDVSHSAWREPLMHLTVVASSPFVAPQWEIVANTLPIYYAGLAFGAWGLRAGWSPSEKKFLAIAFGGAVGGLLLLVALHLTGYFSLPFWNPFSGLGPFASRNQSGLFFASGFLWSIGLSHDFSLDRRRGPALGWLLLAGAFLAAALSNGSRAGIGFCAIGLVLYLGMVAFLSRRPLFLVAAACLFLGALLALSYYRASHDQFWRVDVITSPDSISRSFRLKVQDDTWAMIKEAPLTGVGLGDYEAIFPFYRVRSALDYRVHHAESDWLHFAAESGLPALALVATAILLIIVSAGRRLSIGPSSGTSLAALAVILVAMAHGFFDQSLHTPGIIFPTLLMASFLVSVPRKSEPAPRPFFGLMSGMGLLAASALSLGWLRQAELTRFELQGCQFDSSTKISLIAVEQALVYSPLAWNLHELRAQLLLRAGSSQEALAEFRAARLLEPFALALVLRESRAWFDEHEPAQAIEAAREVVHRTSPVTRGFVFDEYLEQFTPFPEAEKCWLKSGDGDAEFAAISLPYLSPAAAEVSLRQILSSPRPGLSLFADTKLIDFVLQHGGLSGLARLDKAGLKFPSDAWCAAANDCAATGDKSTACAVVVQKLPPLAFSAPLNSLEREYFTHPNDPHCALGLIHAYLQQGHILSAQRIIDHLAGTGGDFVPLSFYRGWIAYLRGDMAGGWTFFKTYIAQINAKAVILP